MASKVKGFRSTAKNLRSLARFMERPIGEAQRKSLRPILDAAKNNLLSSGAYVTGDLYKSMAIRNAKKPRKDVKRSGVYATGKGVRKAHLVEFGTDEHYQPKRGIFHPGAQAKPFLAPAFYSHDQETIRIFGHEVGRAIERQAARLGAKGKR